MRRLLVGSVSLLLASALALAEQKDEADVRERLNKPIANVSLTDTTLEMAVRFLGEASGVEFVVDWRTLRQIGAHKRTPVTLQLKDVPASRALKLVLAAVAEPGQLAYAIRGAQVVISTPEALAKLPTTTQPVTRPITAPVRPGEPSEADKETLAKLEQEFAALQFERVELQDIVQYFRERGNVPIYVNWRALQAAGVTRSTRVSLQSQKAALKLALRRLLSATAKPGELTYGVSGGVVLVSTPGDLRRLVTLVVIHPATTTKADQQLAKALEVKIPNLVLDKVEFQDALAFLRKNSGMNLYVSRRALQTAAVKMSAPVSLRLTNVSTGAALGLCLAEVADTGALNCATVDGVLLVSTPKGARNLGDLASRHLRFAPTAENRQAAQKLTQRIETVNFNTELAKVVSFFRAASGLNIFVDWRSLRPAGITRTSRVRMQLKDVSLHTALTLVLADAIGRKTAAAGVGISEGLLYISTPAVLHKLTPAPTQPSTAATSRAGP